MWSWVWCGYSARDRDPLSLPLASFSLVVFDWVIEVVDDLGRSVTPCYGGNDVPAFVSLRGPFACVCIEDCNSRRCTFGSGRKS